MLIDYFELTNTLQLSEESREIKTHRLFNGKAFVWQTSNIALFQILEFDRNMGILNSTIFR